MIMASDMVATRPDGMNLPERMKRWAIMPPRKPELMNVVQ